MTRSAQTVFNRTDRRLPLFMAAGVFLSVAGSANAEVIISSAVTKNMTCSSGVCTPTAKDAVLNVTDLTGMLAGGNVQINTGSGALARQVEDIVVAAGFSWTSANSLALDAYRSILIDKPVSDAGTGAVGLTTNDKGSGGALSFGTKGSLSFAGTGNSLTIDGIAFTLENSVAALAGAIAGNPGGNYALANSYDASQDGIYSRSPIATTLTGTVQGLGNTISDLSIEHERGDRRAPKGAGMFPYVAATGAIENLRLTKIDYKYNGAGGLVEDNEGYLFADQVSGSVTAKGAPNHGKFGPAAGFALINEQSGTVVFSSANVRVTAGSYAGGLVGENYGTISLSHADGDVGKDSQGGGLVGLNSGPISQSYATGSASLAGLVAEQGSGTVTDSYSTGAVDFDGDGGGGLIGSTGSSGGATISTSYATGAVKSGSGGFICTLYSNAVSDNYWDTTTSGTTYGLCGGYNVSGITGLTTQQLKSGLPAGFDSNIWAENPKINKGFPYLIANPPKK